MFEARFNNFGKTLLYFRGRVMNMIAHFTENLEKNKLTIRKANISEWQLIVDFFDKHLHNLYHDPGFVSSGLIHDKIQRRNVWVAENDGKIVAIAISNNHTLWNLVVHKEFRFQKIGSTLLKHINPKCVRIKYKGGFPDPTSFYVKNGYKPVRLVPSKVTKRKTILLAVKDC